MKKSQSLTTKLWIYLGVFTVVIMLTLWILQIILLNTMYEGMKIKEINKIGNSIADDIIKNPDNFDEYWYGHSFRRGLFAVLISESGEVIKTSNFMSEPSPPPHNTEQKPNMLKDEVFENVIEKTNLSDNGRCCFAADIKRMHTHTVVYGAKILNGGNINYLCIMAPLEAVDATRQVLQKQLMIVSVISIVIALILAYFIAKRTAKPIKNMASDAATLSRGNYTVQFKGGTYREINELATVLNKTARELSKTEKLRRDLMANVSHDLKTPLTIIRSYAEMIRDISGANPQKREEHANVIADEAQRLSLLVNDILDLSKMEAGTEQMKFELFNIKDTVISIVNHFNVFAEKDGYTFTLNADDNDNDMYVYADEHKIEQVIYNLISNAVNHTGDDKKINVTLMRTDGKIRFEVADTGKGIPPEEINLVWNRYYKSADNHIRGIVGTGIGLSIVKQILLLHNAQYGIISEINKGSVFWFELDYALNKNIKNNFTKLS